MDMTLYKRWIGLFGDRFRSSDHAIPLSEKGHQQAITAGEKIKEFFEFGLLWADSLRKHFDSKTPPPGFHCRIWVKLCLRFLSSQTSPYKRARQTAQHIKEAAEDWVKDIREHVLLSEQQFGLFEGTDWSGNELDELFPNEIAYYRVPSLARLTTLRKQALLVVDTGLRYDIILLGLKFVYNPILGFLAVQI